MEAANYKVAAVHVPHGPNSFAYKVEAGGKSIVISGDVGPLRGATRESWRGLIKLAENADLLIMDALHPTPEQIGTVAREAQVKKLVLSHLEGRQHVTNIVKEIKGTYRGEVVVGEDLQTIQP